MSSLSGTVLQLFSIDFKKRADANFLVCRLCSNVYIVRMKVTWLIFKCLEGVEIRLDKECCKLRGTRTASQIKIALSKRTFCFLVVFLPFL